MTVTIDGRQYTLAEAQEPQGPKTIIFGGQRLWVDGEGDACCPWEKPCKRHRDPEKWAAKVKLAKASS